MAGSTVAGACLPSASSCPCSLNVENSSVVSFSVARLLADRMPCLPPGATLHLTALQVATWSHAVRVLVLGAQKGGSGKSLLSLSLAVAARQAGERVAGLDCDPQRSFARWGERRADPDLVVRAVEASQVETMLGRAERNGFTLAVIDTPGQLSSAVTTVLRRADLCLVPCRPSLMDIEATADLVHTITLLERRFAFVLSQTDGRTPARIQEAREILEGVGTVAPGSIGWRAAHQDAVNEGKGATELGGTAGAEIATLWEWTAHQIVR